MSEEEVEEVVEEEEEVVRMGIPFDIQVPEGGWLDGVRGYLQRMHAVKMSIETHADWKFQTVEALVLHHGRNFQPTSTLPIKRGPRKECFSNALNACVWDDWGYAEGYAQATIPCLHAWLWPPTDPSLAVDPTWEDGVGREYFGVAFNPNWVKRRVVDSGYYGIFGSERWEVIVPLLKDGIPDEAFEGVPGS